MLLKLSAPKMSGKGGNCYVDHSLRVVRSQEAVDWELKQYSTDHLNDQANAVSGKGKGNPRKGKTCFRFRQELHFIQDKKCSERGQICRKCCGLGHFKAKCPQVYQGGS